MHLKRSLFVAPVLAVTIGLGFSGVPTAAFATTSAELQTQLDQAEEQLHVLYSAAEQAGYDLSNTTAELDKTNEEISQTEAKIKEQQDRLTEIQGQLGELATSQYKSGGTNVLSLVLNSGSFSNMIANFRYADKVAAQKQDAVSESKELQDSLQKNKTSLEEKKSDQEKLVAEKQKNSDAAASAASAAQSYYDQLSDELKTKLAEEQEAARKKAAEEAAAAAAEAAKRAEETAGDQGTTNTGNSGNSNNGNHSNSGSNASDGNAGGSNSNTSNNNSSGTTTNKPNNSTNNSGSNTQNKPSNNGGSTNKPSGGTSNSGSNISSTPTGSANAMVARAYSIIGSAYKYSGYTWTGDPSTSAFTCSGVVDYALGRSTNSGWPESYYSAVKARGTFTTSLSKLKYGDLVFFRYGGRAPGHVGIYIGGGMMIDSIPNGGVATRSVSFIGGFMGGGSIV